MGHVSEQLKRRYTTIEQLATVDDLERLKTELLLSIKNLLTDFKGRPAKKWLKSYEVKKMMNISTGTLQNLRVNGTLPFTKVGGIIYYDLEEIEKVMDKQKVNSNKSY